MKCEAGVNAGVREDYKDRRVLREREKLSIVPERHRELSLSDTSSFVQQQDLGLVPKQRKVRV